MDRCVASSSLRLSAAVWMVKRELFNDKAGYGGSRLQTPDSRKAGKLGSCLTSHMAAEGRRNDEQGHKKNRTCVRFFYRLKQCSND